MYLLCLISCTFVVIVTGDIVLKDGNSLPDLKWPKKYTFEAEKLSITGGLVENIQYWRTKTKSRVDYNKGAVKLFNTMPHIFKRNFPFGVKYEVHPETTEEKENYLVCKRTNGTFAFNIHLTDILPDEYTFDYVGSEVFEQGTVEKFVVTGTDDDENVKQTLWATYNLENDTWVPVRYDVKEYDMWLDFLKSYVVWKFYNFDTDFDSTTAFNVENVYNCSDSEASTDEISKHEINIIDPENEEHVDQVFNAFKDNHKKIYSDKEEHSFRRNLFQKRMRLVLDNNRKNTGYKLAIHKFADRTPKELESYMGLVRPKHREPDTHKFPYSKSEVKELASNLPNYFDLRHLGIVTPVKDQNSCKSSWTFPPTSAVEGALARKNGGRLLRLSNQAILDCSWGFGVEGCNGGNTIAAYRWIMAHGLPTEEEYGPYANQEGFCLIRNMTTTYSIRGYTNVIALSVEALKVAIVNHGPLSISIHSTDRLFLYKGGVYYDTECDPSALNHQMTLVGYGEREGEEYWIVKNSWGQNWGIDGYLFISTRDNNCGVTSEPSYVVL